MLRSTTNYLALMAMLTVGPLMAQEDFDVYDSEQLDVDGVWNTRPRPTAAGRTKRRVEKLKQKINDQVDNTIEHERLKQEQQLGKRLDNMFKGGVNGGDSVTTTQAAPYTVAKTRSWWSESSAITLSGGFSSMNVSDKDYLAKNSYSSNYSFKTEFSGQVAPHIEIGLGIGHTSVNFKRKSYYDHDWGRGISGDILSVNLLGRFYFSNHKIIRPFISTSVGFNRLALNYDNDNYYNGGNHFYEDEGEFSQTYISTAAGAGVLLQFANGLGLMAQGQFTKNFGGKDDEGFRYSYYGDEQAILKDLGKQISNGGQFDITLGVIITF